MDKINTIRESYYSKGKNIKQIATETGHDRKTIRKYIHEDDFNKDLPKQQSAEEECPPKLQPFQEIIDQWLMTDKQAKRKQRHTAKRVYDRLCTEETTSNTFNCSYRTVAGYVRTKKREIFGAAKEAALPLEHKYGECQADFGAAEFYEQNKLVSGKYLTLAFPASNQGYQQLFRGENAQCLYEGMLSIFEHIGGVPTEIWFDNTSTIVTDIIKGGGRKVTDKFLRFSNHYGFKAVFCNPAAGNEKGCVENKVGYNRRNMLVPIPQTDNLTEFNQELLFRCDRDGHREHYRKNAWISTLFEQDKAAFLPLPRISLDVAGYLPMKTDKYGFIYLNGKKHTYSTSPKYAQRYVTVKLTADRVVILDENYREITVHQRLYGDQKDKQMDWIPYLSQLAKRPRALKYSGIYEMMPLSLQNFITRIDHPQVGNVLHMLSAITAESGFQKALESVSQALSFGATDADSLLSIYRKRNDAIPDMPAIATPLTGEQIHLNPDLNAYAIPTIGVGGEHDVN